MQRRAGASMVLCVSFPLPSTHVHKPEAGTPSVFDPQWGAGLYLLVVIFFLFFFLT